MSVTLLLVLALACAHRSPPEAEHRGLLGIRFQGQPEGLLVISVLPDSGAEAAGLGVGDLIVAIEGQPLDPAARASASERLMGPPGSDVRLTVRGPLGAPEREVSVTRGQPGGDAPGPEDQPEIRRLRRALARGGVGRAERAARALAEADFGGQKPGYAAARALRAEGRMRPDVSAAAAAVLSEARPGDVDLRFLAAEALYRAGAYGEASRMLAEVEAARPADVAGDVGWRGDAGGNPWGRVMLARSLAALGRAEEARAVGLALARTRDLGEVAAELGLPAPPEPDPWRGSVEPAPDFEVPLLDGGAWRLEDQRGRPVLLSFWASWCAPCMEELPQLQALAASRPDLAVLAVSMDDPADRAAVERTVRKLDLRLPVAHAPEIGERFGVGPIPSTRLLGSEGAVRFVDEGYSPEGLERLRVQVDHALAEGSGGEALLGYAWTSGQARLLRFLSLPGLDDLEIAPEGAIVGLAGQVPLRVSAGPLGWSPGPRQEAAPETAASERVAWLEGPVAATVGRPLVRAWDEQGEARWALGTPGLVRDLAVADGALWVATDARVIALDAEGRVLTVIEGGADDLAAAEGGLWAVDGERRRWLTRGGAEDRGPAPDGACALSDGRVASRLAEDCVSGRFGADGGLRAVIAREDGMVVGLDSAGQPAFTLVLPTEARLGAWDPDGDSRDALLVAVRGQGLAWVELTLP